ncbi:ABC transporter ATP-binding protein [Alteriqipengyuania lutimaris]|uniref:sn-glycerol-3-phosphate ABC transporter ATP-binding protein UgpC n=1 Tax=Alteriqipengyuania lutimaris TaxID=1538146 RepID=A0A395LN18_9SPHN|nr:sn-glycerol-3-phosphate ABC transporter ATP-binding protein UgpC [Alteriqipengyuania lutimaris]MBB3032406.1 multiple sugar transport system ATP-binding protein [Alteriqipengyuania lutimaris]RDS78446.1 sn-glycerol-3-phosphate ABC transporter ATP-binding protein UgpC [Alteriqipengyuania lutimaris]
MGEALRLADIAKSYGGPRVIDGLSLDVAPGEFLVLLGPSGCGKSTLLRAIAGLEDLDAGSIHLGEERIDTLPPGRRGVAMVFQQYALYPHMSVRENMSFGLRNAGTDAQTIDERVSAAAASLEIEPLLDRKPGQLSGGQRQRVAIARAIVKEPKLFLLDEPLSNLDAALRTRTRLELAQLHKRLGATMVFVTHDQVEAMTLADRIVVLNGGRIEQCGTPMEIYRRPASKFVAEFVGSPKINLIAGQVDAAQGRAALRLGRGELLDTTIPAADLAGQQAELGVRAEHVGITPPGAGTIDASVVIVERLGERTLVYTRLSDGTQIVAEDRGDTTVASGDSVGLRFESQRAILFDSDGNAHFGEAAQ